MEEQSPPLTATPMCPLLSIAAQKAAYTEKQKPLLKQQTRKHTLKTGCKHTQALTVGSSNPTQNEVNTKQGNTHLQTALGKTNDAQGIHIHKQQSTHTPHL